MALAQAEITLHQPKSPVISQNHPSSAKITRHQLKSPVIPGLTRDLEDAGLRGPTYRLGGRNDG